MSFDATDFLGGLYGERPTVGPAEAEAPGQPQAAGGASPETSAPGAVPDRAASGPRTGTPTASPTSEAPAGPDFDGWTRRPDHLGRIGWEAPGLADWEAWWRQGDFESLPGPGSPCPQCGSLETWWDLTGGQHCQRCERDKLERSLQLAGRAAKLRGRNLPRAKLAAQGGRQRHGAGQPDPKHLDGNRPPGGELGAVAGPGTLREKPG